MPVQSLPQNPESTRCPTCGSEDYAADSAEAHRKRALSLAIKLERHGQREFSNEVSGREGA